MVPMPLCIIWLTVYYTRTESATGLVNIYIYNYTFPLSFTVLHGQNTTDVGTEPGNSCSKIWCTTNDNNNFIFV